MIVFAAALMTLFIEYPFLNLKKLIFKDQQRVEICKQNDFITSSNATSDKVKHSTKSEWKDANEMTDIAWLILVGYFWMLCNLIDFNNKSTKFSSAWNDYFNAKIKITFKVIWKE